MSWPLKGKEEWRKAGRKEGRGREREKGKGKNIVFPHNSVFLNQVQNFPHKLISVYPKGN